MRTENNLSSESDGLYVPSWRNKAELTIWVSKDSNLKQLKITGPLTTDDPQNAVRTVYITLKGK